jgi:hypothetical protein
MSKRVFQIVLLAVMVVGLALSAQAQKTASSAPQKTSSASATCDGALDIVPAKSMSFARKRRPNSASKGDAKSQPAPAAEAKTQTKPSGN